MTGCFVLSVLICVRLWLIAFLPLISDLKVQHVFGLFGFFAFASTFADFQFLGFHGDRVIRWDGLGEEDTAADGGAVTDDDITENNRTAVDGDVVFDGWMSLAATPCLPAFG